MNSRMIAWIALPVVAIVFTGCSQDTSSKEVALDPRSADFLLNREPAGSIEVMAAKESAKDKEEVIVVGRIGGDVDPWVEGMAEFLLADNSLRACNDIPGDECPTPWDYCCDPNVEKGRFLVRVVDEDGNVVEIGARKLLGVKELDTIVVRGTAHREKDGTLELLATGIFVKKN